MKRLLFLYIFISILDLYPQGKPFIVREEYGFVNPIGTLAKRFKPVNSLSIAVGKETSENTTWLGRIDYSRMSDPNYTELTYTRKIQPYKIEYTLTFPVNSIQMELETFGITAEMQYKIFAAPFAEVKVLAGFGLFRWNFKRGTYKDSLTADIPIGDTSATTKKEIVDVFNLTANSQQDWSGGFYTGFDAAFKLYNPVWFTVSAHYKNILGELWPALKIGLENVSGLQMAEYRMGIMIKIDPVKNR
ncbi:MAG: hypothetical protein HY965_07940 [Ignavibacteriales bacterium]|nr:hypothetical protein [Ignavibacteriales bacterium]